MADYFHQHHTQPARVRTRAHSDHTGPVLAGLALLMMAVLALLWLGQSSTLSALPQATNEPAAVAASPIVTAPILSLRAAPAVTPPASDVIAAAGDTRALQP